MDLVSQAWGSKEIVNIKIMSIIGARPQFIKLAPISDALDKSHLHVVVHTGQHYDINMNDVFFDNLNIASPNYNLGIGSGNHGQQTARMLVELEKLMVKETPDLILVYGDTNSTLAASLASSKLSIPIGHIEAGLRSYDKSMPEEVNRILSDHVSTMLFCPTQTAVDNLYNEGIKNGVFLTGDVMVDILKKYEKKSNESNILNKLDLEKKEYYLGTVHRQSNTDNYENLLNITRAFIELGNVVFPCHPRTKKMLKLHGLYNSLTDAIEVIDPLGYTDMLFLQKNAKRILTDSGGIQKEAYILNVPCITLRDNTEWVETVDDGWNVLVGCDKEKIVEMANNFNPMRQASNIFGNGDASNKISEKIEAYFEKTN